MFQVAAELSKRGYIVAPTLRNAKGVDLLVSNLKGKSVGIQVKTTNYKNWILSEKDEKPIRGIFYIFVSLENPPQYYVIPSENLGGQIKRGHRRWLKQPGKRVKKHRDNPMRQFNRRKNEKYHDAWNILGLN